MHCYLKEREDNGIWYIWQYNPATGQCRKHSTRTRDRSLADKALAKFIIRLPERKESDDVTVLQVLLRYWELYAQNLFSRRVVKTVIAAVLEHESTTMVRDFTVPRQIVFAAKVGKTNNSRRRYMGVIAAAFRWSVNRGEINDIPHLFRVKSEESNGVRPFTCDELKSLCDAATAEHERRFLLLCISSAPRPAATLDVTWDRFDATTRVIDYVVPDRQRTKKRRARVPLAASAAAYLEDCRSVGPIIQYNGKAMSTYRMTFDRIAERAGVKGSAYGIRKAVSTWLRREGVPEWDIKGALGHSVGGETDRYAHYRPDYMRAAADAIERLLRELNPVWLSNYFPVEAPRETQVLVSNGGVAGDRTLDQFLKREMTLVDFQRLNASNDD